MLTKEEKLQVINSHKKGLMYTKYNLEIDALSENARPQPNAETISSIDERIEEVEGQLAALDAELARVNALTE
jgi:ABC-type phosphate transport system auxiliary subunit